MVRVTFSPEVNTRPAGTQPAAMLRTIIQKGRASVLVPCANLYGSERMGGPMTAVVPASC